MNYQLWRYVDDQASMRMYQRQRSQIRNTFLLLDRTLPKSKIITDYSPAFITNATWLNLIKLKFQDRPRTEARIVQQQIVPGLRS